MVKVSNLLRVLHSELTFMCQTGRDMTGLTSLLRTTSCFGGCRHRDLPAAEAAVGDDMIWVNGQRLLWHSHLGLCGTYLPTTMMNSCGFCVPVGRTLATWRQLWPKPSLLGPGSVDPQAFRVFRNQNQNSLCTFW